MKKKGLIISTIVMVIVLVASLTTATYAWFTASNVTKIDAFEVSVTSNNAVKIGVSTTQVAPATLSEDAFKTGTVTYSGNTAGTFGSGSWEGDTGLSATIDHNIVWGTQNQAVGFSANTIADLETVAPGALTDYNGQGYAYAANDGTTYLNDVKAAVENNSNADGALTGAKSDYVHFNLAVAPTKALQTNQLIIMIDTKTTTGTTLGIASAIHVAYRITKSTDDAINTTWEDEDLFGSSVYSTLKSAVTNNLTTEQKASYKATYGNDASATGAYALVINDLETTLNAITQIELVIYISGTDDDCNNTAINNAGGEISIFFHTVDAAPAA